MRSAENVSVVTLSAFHLNKNYENSGSGSKGKCFSVCPTGKSGAAQKEVFVRLERPDWPFMFQLQFSAPVLLTCHLSYTTFL